MISNVLLPNRSAPFGHIAALGGRIFVAALVMIFVISGAISAQTFRFSNVDVQGNQRISDATILTTAEITPGETLTAAQVNTALQRLQNSGLFQSVEVTPRGGTLVIAVREFPTINRIAVEGNRRIQDDELISLIQSTPRRTYSPSVAEQDAEIIAEAYRTTGRLTAIVTPQIIPRDDFPRFDPP